MGLHIIINAKELKKNSDLREKQEGNEDCIAREGGEQAKA
jgi:hypothetical protein